MRADFYNKQGAKGLEELARIWKVSDDIKIAKTVCKKGDRVLDLACGYGRVAIPLAKAGRIVTGIDLSGDLIAAGRKRAREHNISIRFDRGTMTSLPYDEGVFDVVLCFWNSFNELLTKRDQRKALNEVYRVLRKGGRAFIVLRDGENKMLRAQLEMSGAGPDRRIIRSFFPPIGEHMAYIHDRESFRTLCQSSHFKKYRIGFRNMNGRRRIVGYLYK